MPNQSANWNSQWLSTHFMVVGMVAVTFILQMTQAHVSMTFPPARPYNLDFLNNFWTKAPCGMPKGNIRTSLEAGKTFNATWHLGYAHQGGYRIELLDSQDNKVMDLTPTNESNYHNAKTTAQWHLVDLPSNLTCEDCTIRLLRQVPEFAPNFFFLSCSDVDIVSKDRYVESCSGRGYQSGKSCICYRGFWGDRCQYEDECEKDNDCNSNGKCIYLGGTALPRRQCFCSSDNFGERCSRTNPFSMPRDQKIDLSKHIKVPLEERITMYFKGIVGTRESDDEIEFVLKINGTSYGGVGWRPVQLGPICKSWPFISDALDINDVSSAPTHKTKRSATFTITKAVDTSDDYKNKDGYNYNNDNNENQHGRIRIASTSTTVTHSQSVSQSRSVGNSHNQHEPNQQSNQDNFYEYLKTEEVKKPDIVSIETIDHGRRTHKKPTTSPVVTLLEESQPQPSLPTVSQIRESPPSVQQIQSQPFEEEPNQVPPELPQREPSEWAAKDPFTPMDCTDIVMGAARGKYSRIRDAYARGRHTPLLDSIWGGRDDLTAATGWETNGMTTLIFRRKVRSSDGPDHSLQGEMLVIWARGQQPNEKVSHPHFQLERDNSVASDFYTEDEYKYHGLGPQRGLLYIDFTVAMKEFTSRFI